MASRKAKDRREQGVSSRTPLRHSLAVSGLALLLATTVVITYWPVLDVRAMTFDDTDYLINNQRVQHPSWTSAGQFLTEVLEPSTVKGYYQPLAMISLMLDYAAGGRPDDLRPFHRTSLALHVVNTLLLMALLYMLFGKPWIAAGGALLFGVHPMTVESIAWVSERKTLLAAFFVFGCLIAYVRYTRRCDWKSYVACAVLYALSLMAKPTSIPIPLALLLMDFWPLNRLSKRAVLEKIPLFMVGILFAVITIISQARTSAVVVQGEHSLIQAPLILGYDIVFYLCKFVWPVNLTALYPIPKPMALSNPTILVAVIGSCLLVAGLLFSVRRTPALLTGWLIFMVVLFPASGVVGFTTTLTADRHFYLPAIGYLLVVVWLLGRLAGTDTEARSIGRPVAVGLGVIAAASLLVAGTRHYLEEWQTTVRHKFYMLKLAPNSPIAHFGCGNFYKEKGQDEQAIPYFSQAIALKPDYVQAYLNRGSAWAGVGDYARALQDYDKVVELSPDYAETYNNRGLSNQKLHHFDKAIRDFTKAIELAPEHAQAYNNRGSAYNDIREYQRAERDFTRAIELMPAYAQAHNNRGVIYNNTHDYKRAIGDFARAIERMPECAETYVNRGNAYIGLRNYSRAIVDYNKAIKLKSNMAIAYCNRGHAYAYMGDHRKAIEDYNRAVDLQPDCNEAYCNRGIAYGQLGDYQRSLDDLSRAIEIKPDYTEALYNRGITYGVMADYGRAIREYTKAIELQPVHAHAYTNRGNAYLGLGDSGSAIKDHCKAIELKPDYAQAYHNRASAYYYVGAYAKGLADIEKCRQLGGHVNPHLREALTQASSRPG